MFKTYEEQLLELLKGNSANQNWKRVSQRHQVKISQIQHERLIHLLVTMFVGLAMEIAALAAILSDNILLFLLATPLLILFTAYIFHYRYLENTTQRWYGLLDKINLQHISYPKLT